MKIAEQQQNQKSLSKTTHQECEHESQPDVEVLVSQTPYVEQKQDSEQEQQDVEKHPVDQAYEMYLTQTLPQQRTTGLQLLSTLQPQQRNPLPSWTRLNLCPQVSKDKTYEIALIDSDVLRYELGAITTNHAFVKGYRIPAAAEFIQKRCEEKVLRINAATGGVKHMCVFSGSGNFRFGVASVQKYKGNRDGFEKPEHWITVNDYLKETQPHVVVNGREADDYLAERQRRTGNTIICTRDKDLLVTPGWHYRWSCGENQPEVPPHFVSELEAWRNFFIQILTGDTTDN
ncbi:hypothetical protein, partial [Herbiconiux daphne]